MKEPIRCHQCSAPALYDLKEPEEGVVIEWQDCNVCGQALPIMLGSVADICAMLQTDEPGHLIPMSEVERAAAERVFA